MRRQLGSFETALTLTGRHAPFVVAVVLHLERLPPPERLRRAFETLQRCYPVLGARIVDRSGGFWFESEGVPPIPLRWLQTDSGERWRTVVEDELNRPIDELTGPLLRCTAIAAAGGTEGALVLTFHHAALDGVSGAALLRRFLRLCQAGSPPELSPSPEPPPMESFLPAAFRGGRRIWRLLAFLARQMGDEITFRLRSRGARKPPIEEPTRCRVLPVELPAAETAALTRRARRERVTLPSALTAAFLLAVLRHLYDGRAQPLRTILFADLRPYLRPPLADEPLGSYISMLRYTVAMGPGRSFWPLAREITGQTAASLHRGEKFAAALLGSMMMRLTLSRRTERMATTAVSYSVIARLGDTGSTGLRGINAFVSNFGLGPEYTAQVKLFRGRLLLDVVYLESDMDQALAETLAGEILAILQRAGERRV